MQVNTQNFEKFLCSVKIYFCTAKIFYTSLSKYHKLYWESDLSGVVCVFVKLVTTSTSILIISSLRP